MFQKIAVLGSGNGGCAMAADLSMSGYDVNLYEDPKFVKNINSVKEQGGIEVIAEKYTGEKFELPAGGSTGFARIKGTITSNMKEALNGVDLIMLIVPGFVREKFIRKMAPFLENGQTILVWCAYFGALQCHNLLKEIGVKKTLLFVKLKVFCM